MCVCVCVCVWLCSYVSAMVPVKTMKEYELLQDLTVLFCETVDRFVISTLSLLFNVKFAGVRCSVDAGSL